METEKEAYYLSAAQMAKAWGITPRRVRFLCACHKVFGARRDKATGEWKIPRAAERPVDGRAYRYRKVPKHFYGLVQHADIAVANIVVKMPAEECWLHFVRGSAFHLYKLTAGDLRFCDVCDIVDGKTLPDRSAEDQRQVVWHVRTLGLVRRAVVGKRRLTMTLVREIAASLQGGRPARCNSAVDAMVMQELVRKAAHAKTHPLITAGDVVTEMYWKKPFRRDSERIGYMLANFILMREGYPPIVLFRAVFRTMVVYWEVYREWLAAHRRYGESSPEPVPPAKYRAFLNACVIRAVLWSCRQGLRL